MSQPSSIPYSSGIPIALMHGLHEIKVSVPGALGNPFTDIRLQAEFARPDGSMALAEGFYDGGRVYKVRAYCGQEGLWSWRLRSNHEALEGHVGEFLVEPSVLPGKLRLHPADSRQFTYNNGEPFLHIGDTGYRYVADTEPYWREYLDQAAAAGFTKIRVWFCQGRSDIGALFQSDRSRLNLSYWQEMDRRIAYAHSHYPHLQLQLIPFGEDEEAVLRFAEGDPSISLALRYAVARFSAYPAVQWCISNDLVLENGEAAAEREGDQRTDIASRLRASIRLIAMELARLEPWGTLLTNHQSRFGGYSFVGESWSDIITVEDLGQVTGELIRRYRSIGERPVVLDEDRYEHWKAPVHPRYYFRRLMWSSLLSGGHATYGGLHAFRPFDGELAGMYGYYDACRDGKLKQGAHDFIHIHRFFRESGFDLAGAVPDDGMAGSMPLLYKAMRIADGRSLLVYLANPTVYEGHSPHGFGGVYTDEQADAATVIPEVSLLLEAGRYEAVWFHPSKGEWTREGICDSAAEVRLQAPGSGDWILLLRRMQE
ncbi:DUF4038 domain-containing protein [Paenibacillus sp. PAMC21692]|uniref:apiosidase-like domain-containing protein n=1 Tax=Paenibacillus sp. PAMC21692 TaxID=2762320 RepID=UPI00164E982E|nr:DUF4038 domain-containing protein [Paenibacillus sp. PAMC21692]QNK57020.1 DUF4038 domain-containing protein [Paenibacillus sp. PAMC21692]